MDVHQIGKFWAGQPFDLELDTYQGRTLSGNCDLCFLKPANQIFTLIQVQPERADWWAKMESFAASVGNKASGMIFRSDRPSYAQMAKFAAEQRRLFNDEESPIACFCGD